MIASVAGDVALRRADHVVVETAGGVGYRLSVSAETLRQVPAVGGTCSLLTHLVVREDAMTLYGFATEEERELFELLTGVQGVGPKMALADFYKVPTPVSLGVVAGILALSVVLSLLVPKKPEPAPENEPRAA